MKGKATGLHGRAAADCRVAICVATRLRPEGLRALLRSLDALVFECVEPELCIVVADNDPGEAARKVCEELREGLAFPLAYVVEARPGVPCARNASVAPVLDRVDWIAFIDDDEIADPHWLDALLRAQRASGADVVSGPVRPRFSEPPPGWVVEGAFFEPPDHADRAPRGDASTNNALVRASRLAGLATPFDEDLQVLGEDTDLFVRLQREGARIVWARDAVVIETVPPERATLGWLLRRGFAEGVARVRIERRHGLCGVEAIVARGVGRLLQGVAEALLPLPLGRAARARGLRRAAFGLGRCAGLLQ